jgi:hypothetical protein
MGSIHARVYNGTKRWIRSIRSGRIGRECAAFASESVLRSFFTSMVGANWAFQVLWAVSSDYIIVLTGILFLDADRDFFGSRPAPTSIMHHFYTWYTTETLKNWCTGGPSIISQDWSRLMTPMVQYQWKKLMRKKKEEEGGRRGKINQRRSSFVVLKPYHLCWASRPSTIPSLQVRYHPIYIYCTIVPSTYDYMKPHPRRIFRDLILVTHWTMQEHTRTQVSGM